MRATLLLSDPSSERNPFLGMPVVLRVSLRLAELGIQEIALHGPGAAETLGLLMRDPRMNLRARLHEPDSQASQLVLLADTFVSAPALAHLADGTALAEPGGQPVAARLVLGPDSDPQQLLASASVVPLATGQVALRLNDSANRRRVEALLFAELIKPSDGPVSRHFNRHVSRALTRLLIPFGVTPNGMTVVVAFAGLCAAAFASLPSYGMHVAGALLFQLHSILDGCDGELARLTHRFGKHGALIDSLVDDLSNVLFFVGLSWGVARKLGEAWPMACGGITALAYVGVVTVQYGVVLRATGRGDKTKFWAAPPRAERPSLFGIARAMLRRDVFVVLILVAVVLGLAPAAVCVFPFAALGTLGASLARLRQVRGAA